MKLLKLLIILFILFLIDISSKYIALNKLYLGGVYLFNLLTFEFYKNPGIAFGISIFKYLIMPLSFIIIIIFIVSFQKYISTKKYILSFFIGLVIIGAISNLMDRIILGYVIDFISIWIFPVFNLADLYITSGIIGIIFLYKKSPTKKMGEI